MGRKKSASSIVTRPLRSSCRERCGPTPFKNWSGVASPAAVAGDCLTAGIVLYSLPVLVGRISHPRSDDGPAVRRLWERSLRRSLGQPRAQADQAALVAESRVDAGPGGRPRQAGASLHALPEGGQGHEGHLSTHGRGRRPLPNGNWWEAATPHRETTQLTSSSFWPPSSSPSRISPPLARDSPRERRPLLTSSSSWPPSSWPWSHSPPFRCDSVAHRVAAQMLGLLAAAVLIVDQVRVELGKADHLEAALFEQAVEHARVVGCQDVKRTVRLRRRTGAQGGCQGCRVALDVAMDACHSQVWRDQ